MIAQIDRVFFRLGKTQIITRLASYLLFEGRPITTKGRWFNPVVFAFLKIVNRITPRELAPSPVFILGTGRSGTTILGVSLGIHPDVAFLNEPKAVWAYAYPEEDLVGSYNNRPARYSLKASDCRDDTKEKMTRIYDFYLRLTHRSLIVDKYPELIFRVSFVKEIFPNAKFIFLYRDGRDTAVSIENWSKNNGEIFQGGIHDWWGVNRRKWKSLCREVLPNEPLLSPYIDIIEKYDNHAIMATVEWIVSMQEGLRLIKKYPDAVMPLRYEDYVQSEDVRNNVLKFCDLKESGVYSEYCARSLRYADRKASIQLPNELKLAFEETMKSLGYQL